MTDEQQWLARQLGHAQAALQHSRREFLMLAEHLEDITPVWADNCALEMRRHYLTPAADHAESAHLRVRAQSDSTTETLVLMGQSSDAAVASVRHADHTHYALGQVESLDLEIDFLGRGIESDLAASQAHQEDALAGLIRAEQLGNAAPAEA